MKKGWLIAAWVLGLIATVFVAPIGLTPLTLYELLLLVLGIWLLIVCWSKDKVPACLAILWFVGFLAFHMITHWQHIKMGHMSPQEQIMVEGGSNLHLLQWVFVTAIEQMLVPINIALSVVVIAAIAGSYAFVMGLKTGNTPAD